MKIKLKAFFLLFTSTAIIFSACKKSSEITANQGLTPKQVAGLVGPNFGQALAVEGQLSGIIPLIGNIHDCGTVVDTTLSVESASGGGSFSFTGTIKVGFTCTNNVVSGYTGNFGATIDETTDSLINSGKFAENLTVTGLDFSNPAANTTLNGSMNLDASYQIKIGNIGSGNIIFNFTLNSIVVNPGTEGILRGSATFNTNGTGPKGDWNYQGTIFFNGTETATVNVNGTVWKVNLQTGAVT